MADLTDDLADGPLAGDGTVLSQTEAFVEGWSFSEAWLPLLIPGGLAGDNFTLGESFVLNLTRNAGVIDYVRMTTIMRLLAQASITEHVTITEALTAWVNALIKDGFKFTQTLASSFTFNLTVTQALRLAEALDIHNHVSLTDAFVGEDSLAIQFKAGAQIVEALKFSVDLSTHLVMRIAMTQPVEFEDATLLKMIFSDTIVENILAELLYQSPDGNVTTWAINTRTNAVSEYRDFAFNSFASMGRKYIAADQNGLYELNGPRDITNNIIARFGGGYFQPNGAKFAGLKGVYIGAKGQGKYILKLITGDGSERFYRVVLNPGLMTTKVNIGKGIRARYIAWELINEDGQDFDFDQIEFVPMLSGRRV